MLQTHSVFDPQCFESIVDPDSSVEENGKVTPHRKLPILPNSALHTSIDIPSDSAPSQYVLSHRKEFIKRVFFLN